MWRPSISDDFFCHTAVGRSNIHRRLNPLLFIITVHLFVPSSPSSSVSFPSSRHHHLIRHPVIPSSSLFLPSSRHQLHHHYPLLVLSFVTTLFRHHPLPASPSSVITLILSIVSWSFASRSFHTNRWRSIESIWDDSTQKCKRFLTTGMEQWFSPPWTSIDGTFKFSLVM